MAREKVKVVTIVFDEPHGVPRDHADRHSLAGEHDALRWAEDPRSGILSNLAKERQRGEEHQLR